jgi:hypothetical protein
MLLIINGKQPPNALALVRLSNVARIRRGDGKFFTYKGVKTDGITTAVQSNEGAAHSETIRMIEKREVA